MKALIHLLAGAVAAAGPAWTGASGETVAGQDQGIVWSSGPRVRSDWARASPQAETRRYECGGRSIAFELRYEAGDGSRTPRLAVRRLAIERRRIARERLAAINALLAEFPSPPEVILECSPDRVRLNLLLVTQDRLVRSETVPLD